MKYKILVILVTLVIAIIPLTSTVHAQESNPYYTYNYEIVFSKDSVPQNEVFGATIKGDGTCNVDLIVKVNSVEISGVIYGLLNDKQVVLNDGFILAVQDLPNSRGQSFSFDETVPLVFPDGSLPGRYDIYVEMNGLRTQVLGIWIDDSGNISQTPFLVGSIECLPQSSITTSPTSPPANTTSPVPIDPVDTTQIEKPAQSQAIFIFLTLLMLVVFVAIMVKISRDIHASV